MIVTGPGAGNAGDSAIAAVRSAIARLMPGVGARRSSARDPSECLHGHACLTRWCGALRVGALHDRQALSGPGERGWLQAWAGRAQGRDVQKAKGRSQPEARARAGAEHVYAAPATPVVASMAATTQLIGQDAGSATSAGDPGAGPAAASPAYPDGDGDSGDSTPAPPSGGGAGDTATAGRRLLQAQARCTRRRRRTRALSSTAVCACADSGRCRVWPGLLACVRTGAGALQSPLRSRNLARYTNPILQHWYLAQPRLHGAGGVRGSARAPRQVYQPPAAAGYTPAQAAQQAAQVAAQQATAAQAAAAAGRDPSAAAAVAAAAAARAGMPQAAPPAPPPVPSAEWAVQLQPSANQVRPMRPMPQRSPDPTLTHAQPGEPHVCACWPLLPPDPRRIARAALASSAICAWRQKRSMA